MHCIKRIGFFCVIFFAVSLWSGVVAQHAMSNEIGVNSADESQFLSNIRQLTYDGKRAGEGYFSEDGNALIFQSEREPDNPFYQIYLLDLLTGDTHRVSTGVGKTTCAFFRPGTDEVLYASTHHDVFAKAKQEEELKFRASGKERRYSWDYDEAMDIFSANRDGSNLKQLTNTPGYDAEASYSPDGKYIVFCSLRDAYPKSQLSPKGTEAAGSGSCLFRRNLSDECRRLRSDPLDGLTRLRWRPPSLPLMDSTSSGGTSQLMAVKPTSIPCG